MLRATRLGTGKTTWLARQVEKWAHEHGTDQLLVASFTRAAAAEIASRLHDPDGRPTIPEDNVGTLHAHAYRALDQPDIAETKLGEWNDTHPAWRLSAGNDRPALEDAGCDPTGRGGTDADDIQRGYERLRHRRVDRRVWPASVRAFATAWEGWLADTGRLDFTGMIETALAEVPAAPGRPAVGLYDEVQDFTALELALVRSWGQHMERVVLVGDDDQCVYSFKGASPDAFLDPPVPDDHKRVLAHSWRVPAAVHAAATAWVERLSRREPKEYWPRQDGDDRPVEGSVTVRPAMNYRYPETLVEEAAEHAEAGRTVMVLASCSYMLDPTKAVLRHWGVPFHNPYRRRRGDWNPLGAGGPGRTTAGERLLAYLRPDRSVWGGEARRWTGEDLKAWADPVRQRGVMKRGCRNLIASLAGTDPVSATWLRDELFAPVGAGDFSAEVLGARSLDWYERVLLPSRRAAFDYPLRVARVRGAAALRGEPRVVVGTIHSVKGGEADVVYLFPDMSIAGMREWGGAAEDRDAVVRQFYVGMTRARDDLVVTNPATAAAVDPYLLTKGALHDR